MANEAQMKFAATSTTVISMAVDITDTTNTYTGQTSVTTTELNNSVNLYPLATATIYLPDGWLTTAPTDGTTIDLYMTRNDVDSTNDDAPVPASSDLQGAEYVGSFLVSNQTAGTAYRKTITISLVGVKKAFFYIKNNTGQTMDYVATAMTVKVHPFTYAPAT
jgi:hypothetical protein